MTTKKNLVKSMLMSIATAGIFSFGFSSCSDDINEFDNHGFKLLLRTPQRGCRSSDH